MNIKITYIIALITSFYLMYFGYVNLNKTPNLYFLITNFIINTLLIVLIIKNYRNYSLKNIVYIFLFIFFGISPIFQFNNNFYVWGEYLKDKEIIISNLSIIFIILIFNFTSRPIFKIKNFNPSCIKESNKYLNIRVKQLKFSMSLKSQFILFIFLLFLFYNLISQYNFNIINFIYRSGDSENGFSGNQISFLFFSYFIRPLIFNSFIFYFFCKNKSYPIYILVLFISIFAIFPTGVPRFFAATIYLTLFCIIINYYTKFDLSLFLIISIGLIFIFPFLDLFRWMNLNNNIFDYSFNFDLQSGNFDAYGMYTLAINRMPILYGSNFFSAFLFFIPRTLWPSKSIGSGALVSNKLNLELDNVSMPLFAEGYLAFGFLGIIFIVLILSRYVYTVDYYFYNYISTHKISSPIILIIYLNLIFLLFFMLRGDFLSSFAYLIGITFANLIIYKFMNFLTYSNE